MSSQRQVDICAYSDLILRATNRNSHRSSPIGTCLHRFWKIYITYYISIYIPKYIYIIYIPKYVYIIITQQESTSICNNMTYSQKYLNKQKCNMRSVLLGLHLCEKLKLSYSDGNQTSSSVGYG